MTKFTKSPRQTAREAFSNIEKALDAMKKASDLLEKIDQLLGDEAVKLWGNLYSLNRDVIRLIEKLPKNGQATQPEISLAGTSKAGSTSEPRNPFAK
jgi:hypothetical protein